MASGDDELRWYEWPQVILAAPFIVLLFATLRWHTRRWERRRFAEQRRWAERK